MIYSRQIEPLRRLGRLADAEPILRLLLQSRTTLPQVYRDLAELARTRGEQQDARRWTEQWLQLDSDDPDQHWQQACAALELDNPALALTHLRQVLDHQPDHAGALEQAPRLLLQAGCFGEALRLLQRRLVQPHQPDPEVLASAALAAIELERYADAAAWSQACLALPASDPWQTVASAVRARLLQRQGLEADALALTQQALARGDAPWPVARLLAPLLLELQQLEQAQAVLVDALAHQPQAAELHLLQAQWHWLHCQLHAGFLAYQWRQPCWHGSTLPPYVVGCKDAPLVLLAEGTLGDTLLFSRYAPWLQQRLGLEVCLVVQPPLLQLLRSNFAHQLLVESYGTAATLTSGQILPLLSAPALFGTCQEHPELSLSHLHACPDLVEQWREHLDLSPRERLIGLNWHGSALQGLSERYRSDIPLDHFAPLAALPDARLLSLQKGVGSEQLSCCSFTQAFVASQQDVNGEYRLEHIAALMTLCDWIVCDDSGPAHLAGSLGLRSLVLLPERINWRWASSGLASPWYPNSRLLRKRPGQGWDALVQEACGLIG